MAECVLVDQGHVFAHIVGQKTSWDASQEAIHEFQAGVAKSTGVRLPIDAGEVLKNQLEPVRSRPVRIQFILADHGSGLGKDGFRLRSGETAISFEAETKHGFMKGVYFFLKRYCGFEWLWPGPTGEVCESKQRLAIPVGDIEDRPKYLWRHLLFSDMEGLPAPKWSPMEFHMPPNHATMAEYRLWCRRNQLGGYKTLIGHTWGAFVNPDEYGQTHPEYFAETNGSRTNSIAGWPGKHGGQLCTTNPDVINLLVKKVRQFFDEHPDYDVISISPNDGTGFCECDRCISLDVKYGNPAPNDTATKGGELAGTFKDDADKTGRSSRITGPITDRMFDYANAVARQIAESHPNKMLLLLVYSLYRDPPRMVKLAPNIIAQYCLQCHQHWDEKIRESDYRDIQTLKSNAPEVGIYEYYDQGAWPGVVRSFPDLISRSVSTFHQIGVRHYSTQGSTGFATNGFNFWFLAKALWDPQANVDVCLAEYCRKAFGQAAPTMVEYYNLWRNRWKECRGLSNLGDAVPGSAGSAQVTAPFDQIRYLYPRKFLEKCNRTLDEARRNVAPDSQERTRIEFVARGWEATSLAVRAAEVTYALRDRGWPMLAQDVTEEVVRTLGDPQDVRRQAQEALTWWNRWEGFVESVRDDFVVSHFWTRYCFDSRKGLHPHMALEKILAILSETSNRGQAKRT